MSKQEDYSFIIEMKLRKELKSAGITITQVAEKMGISREYAHKMIKPEKLTVGWLIEMCEKCDIPIKRFVVLDDLINGDGIPETNGNYALQEKILNQQKLLEEKDKTNLAQEVLIKVLQKEIERLKS